MSPGSGRRERKRMEHTCGGVRSLQMRSSYIQIATPILFGSNSPPSLLHSRQKYLCLSAYAGGFMRRCHFVSSVPHMSARCPQGKTHVRWHSLCLGLHSWPNSPRARHSRLLILPFFLIMYAIIEHMFFFFLFLGYFMTAADKCSIHPFQLRVRVQI